MRTYSLLPRHQILHVVDGNCGGGRQIGLEVDGQEVIDLPLALEFGGEGLGRNLLGLVLASVSWGSILVMFHACFSD